MAFRNFVFFVVVASIPNVFSLWPIPRSLETGNQFLKISDHFDIMIDVKNPPSDLLAAVDQAKKYLQTDKLQRLVVSRGENDSHAINNAPSLSRLTLSMLGGNTAHPIAHEAVQKLGERVEGYSLNLPSDGSTASITANSTLGLFRGLTTFGQLWYELDGTTYAHETPVKIINDAPVYPYRGFMLDTARNFFPVADIKRTLDAMSWVKMSTFHWHAVDSQSFPVQIPGFLELSQKGAYSKQETYTTADIQDIVGYAGARGIDVLMEIDNPGHTAIISASHPEHIACALTQPWNPFAGEPPAGQLRMASPATTNFTASFLTAIAKTLPSSLFHTGGDEINTNCYANDPQTQADLMNSGRTLEQALDVFTQATHSSLMDIGKGPVVWEEMALEHNVTLSNDTAVMVWISSQHAAAVASKGLKIIHAPNDYFYLDCGAGAWLGNSPTANSGCDFRSWQKAYTFDPLANLTAAQYSLVLGGQQLLWAEQSGPENIDSIAWPRAASSAEVFWTGPSLPDGSLRNVVSALPRMHDIRFRMVQRGVRAIRLQPMWCALRPGLCDS